MKFMITWKLHKNKRHEALKAFSAMSDQDDSNDLGGVRLIGRWHDMIGFTGTAIAETDDPKALSSWLMHWNNVLDVRSVPVLDDNEARELGRQMDR